MILNGKSYRDMVISGANNLANERENINRLNVFPVPDGDTGINMSLTMNAVRTDLPSFDGNVSQVADKVANMLLRGARGNSGVILSLFFRGIAKECKGKETVDSPDLAAAFKRGVDAAYKSVMKPTEGTILTVMRVSAERAVEKAHEYKGRVEEFLPFVLSVAEETLAKTPEMLPVLKQAGLVDAGGRGLVVIFEGMVAYLKGQPIALLDANQSEEEEPASAFEQFNTEDIVYPYCTECIVGKSEAYLGEGKAEQLHKFVLSAGDSAVFVDDTDIIKLHVHTSDPGKVLSEALKFGSLLTIKIENMREQHSALSSGVAKDVPVEAAAPAEEEVTDAAPEKKYGFVAVASGEGMVSVFRDLGADQMVIGGQTMNPSTEDMLKAIRMTPAENVIVLPNNSTIYMVAAQAALLVEDKHVEVLRSVSLPQGISAMLAFNPDAEVEENVATMKEAMAAVSSLSMTFAAHDSTFDNREIKENQILGLVENKVRYVTDTKEECMANLCDDIKAKEAYSVTVFYGDGVSEAEAEAMQAIMQENLGSDVDIMLVNGGQPVYYFIISAE
ncbi:MAG: DAK2 domain-containing protein [Clostridia bacterium]|nr:DAK2 domain-containing protein [Clostridia bacterium]